MERAGQDKPRGEHTPDHHKPDSDLEHDRGGEAGTPKRRSRHALWAAGITILMISAGVFGAFAFSAGKMALGDSAIPVDEPAVFDAPPSLQAAVPDGWKVAADSDSFTSVRNAELNCTFRVRNLPLNKVNGDGEDRIFGDIAATEGALSTISKVMMQSIGTMSQTGGLQKLNVPQETLDGPGLEFITMRLDYSVPGTGEPGTIRIGARSMLSSGATLTAVLLCPTSVLEEGNDPWKTLMANSVVMAGD